MVDTPSIAPTDDEVRNTSSGTSDTGLSPREKRLQDELQHRVRNILATVRSLFDRTVANGDTLENVSNHFSGRLDALSRYQGPTIRQLDAGVDLENIVREELRNFSFGDEFFISISGPNLRLDGDALGTFALAIHELATNSLKFGVLSGEHARAHLDICWRVDGGTMCFHWKETGVAVLGSAPLHRGFGREYLEQALPYQIRAETHFDLRPGGVACTINIPVAALSSESIEG